jgi:hypothetical protein
VNGRALLSTSARAWVCTAAMVAAALSSACGEPPPSADNELPKGVVDTPTSGETLRPGPTFVGGWAVDDTRVVEIRIYFDGRFAARTTPTVARPDVAKVFPAYARPGDLYGWNVVVDFGATAGPHTVIAQAVDTHGATRDIGVVPVTGPR